MTFFEQQISAKNQTRHLIVLFLLAVVGIVLAVHSFVTLAWLHLLSTKEAVSADPLGLVTFLDRLANPDTLLFSSAFTLPVIAGGSFFKMLSLRGGGKEVASSLGGKLLSRDTDDAKERRLLNIVEEMAIATGSPVPPVYILEEDSINAFAAGFTLSDAVIGINRGTINLLTRDELQGVIAHEFSHILNGDMRLNLRLIGIVHGILVISIIGRLLIRASTNRNSGYVSTSRDGNKGNGALFLLGGGLALIGWIGVLSGRLIKAAISRQREFLADSSAVQYTRNPLGISGALKKIGGWMKGSQITHPRAEEASHIFFGNALGRSFFQLFATHPPLIKRIQRLEPSFNGKFPEIELYTESATEQVLSKFQSQHRSIEEYPEFFPVETIGAVTPLHLKYSHHLLGEIPLRVHQEVRSLLGAQGIVLALLLPSERMKAQKYVNEYIKDDFIRSSTATAYKLLLQIGELDHLRLPLLDLAIPTLRELHSKEKASFLALVKRLVYADNRISLFEFMLHFVLERHIGEADLIKREKSIKESQFRHHAQILLSAAVVVSSKTSEEHQITYLAGAKEIPELIDTELSPMNDNILQTIDKSLHTLQDIEWKKKEALLRALQRVMLFDEKVTVSEAELFRAIADALHCPVPPILQFAQNGTA